MIFHVYVFSRSSFDSSMVHGVQKQLSADEAIHPTLVALKQEGKDRDRKISWSPGMGPTYGST